LSARRRSYSLTRDLFVSCKVLTCPDVPTILALIQELAIYEKEPDAVKATEASLLKTLRFYPTTHPESQNLASTLILLEDDKPAGMALYFTNYSTWRAKGGIYLEDLFVRPEFRKKGYGARLLEELARLVTEMEGGRLEWSVLDWNEPSIKFYESEKVGAKRMAGWSTMRVDEESLVALAKRGQGIQL
jgi:GNAT superfamily N-acetyltransferase